MWDPFVIDATVIKADEFTDSDVELFYYQDPVFSQSNIVESPANMQSHLIIPADFKKNDMTRIVRYATPTCRFTSGSKVMTTEAQIITYPFTGFRDPKKANSIHCKTPKWDIENEEQEKASLEVSLNGQNYIGA